MELLRVSVIMKLKTPNSLKPGFTLIELLVVFSMAVIFAVFTIPTYINFNRTQEVKQSALFLKSQIRRAQNSSLSGEKSTTSCSPGDVLTGFFIELKKDQNSFIFGGHCGNNDFNKITVQLPSASSSISGFYDASSLPTPNCSAIVPGNGSLRINYLPVGQGIEFYDWNNLSENGIKINYSKIAVKISNDAGNIYFIIISSSGEINEAESC